MTRCWFCVPIYLIQEPWIMVRTLHTMGKRLAVMASQWFTQTNLSRIWSERRKFDVERSKRTSKRTRGKKYVAISSHENNMIRCSWLIMWALFWALLSWLKTYIQRQPQRQWQATEHHFYFIWTPLNRHNWTRNVSEMIRTNEDGGKFHFISIDKWMKRKSRHIFTSEVKDMRAVPLRPVSVVKCRQHPM